MYSWGNRMTLVGGNEGWHVTPQFFILRNELKWFIFQLLGTGIQWHSTSALTCFVFGSWTGYFHPTWMRALNIYLSAIHSNMGNFCLHCINVTGCFTSSPPIGSEYKASDYASACFLTPDVSLHHSPPSRSEPWVADVLLCLTLCRGSIGRKDTSATSTTMKN